jgi:hypothetical protein
MKVWKLNSEERRIELLSSRCVFADAMGQWKFTRLNYLDPSREIPKRATTLLLLRNGKSILVGDKFGDVFK